MANTSPPNTPDEASEKARRDAATARETVANDMDEAKRHLKEDMDSMRSEAQAGLKSVGEEARGFAEGQKRYAADQVSGIASAIGKAGSELRSSDAAWASRWADQMAHGLDKLAERTRNASVDELVDDVQRFGRERPGTFLATAALLGFAASRFLSASASRREPRTEGGSSGDRYGGGRSYGSGTYGSGTYGSNTYGSSSYGSDGGEQ